MAIRIATYNCHSFKSSIDDIRVLCSNHDVVLLQETWLMESELPLLSRVDEQFYYKGLSSMDTSSTLISGRPFGGLAILWSKRLGTACKPVLFGVHSDVMGLMLPIADVQYLLLNVYMPFCCGTNLNDFILNLHHIDSIISTAETPYVFVAGDFNADTTRDHLFGRKLVTFCEDNNLLISDTLHLQNSFTFLSSAHQSMSWLDHVICTRSSHSLLSHCQVLYDIISSDHFPLSFQVAVSVNINSRADTAGPERRDNNISSTHVKWDTLSQDQLSNTIVLLKMSLVKLTIAHTYSTVITMSVSLLIIDMPLTVFIRIYVRA